MESEPEKESEQTNKSKEKKEIISTSSTTATQKEIMNDKGNVATPITPSRFLQKNPLLIDLILDATLSNLSLKDLLSCRLVCQDWDRIIRISLRKVKSKCPELRFSFQNNDFLETMRDSLSIPYGKFQLRFAPSNPDLSKFQKLINVCSNKITSLHLALDLYNFKKATPTPGPASNKTTFQNWLKALKNLTKLTITDFDFGVLGSTSFFEPGFKLNLDNLREFCLLEVSKESKLSSQFFDGFFTTAQNLKKMSFGVKDYYREECHLQILELLYANVEKAMLGVNLVLNSVLKHGKLGRIKSLTFKKLNNVILTTLVELGEKGLKLESFQAQGKIRFGDISFFEFLETQKASLKTLEISGGCVERSPTLRLRFPSEMKELRSLTLSNIGPLEITESICYTSRFPKLRKLYVESGHKWSDYRQDAGILDIFFPEMENLFGCKTLKELKMVFTLPDDEPIGEDDIFQRVSRIFPDIVIRVQVDDGPRETTLKIFGNL